MVAPAGGDEALLEQGLELDLVLLPTDEIEAEVGFAARHRRKHLVGARIEDLDPDLRIALVIARDHLREEVVDGRRHAGDRDFAHAGGGNAPDAKQRLVKLVEQLLDLAVEVASHRREVNAPRRAVEQPHAKRLLQLFDAPAEGRLGHVQCVGRLAEAAELGHGPKRLQIVEIEVDGQGRPLDGVLH